MATKMTREEALNKVRQMSLPKETMEIFEALAPELKESEDERIRKWLVNYFSTIKEMIWIHRDITCEQILDWLEKQKEQNLIMANSPQLKEQKQEKFPPYVTGFKGDPDPAGVWKPSEEQMNALYDILHPADTVNRLALKSLYEQLKAL